MKKHFKKQLAAILIVSFIGAMWVSFGSSTPAD
ncbi:MAG: hypothetical protein K0S45_3348, partial [Nitrospira sp.]|nr:hypothetical protein [Nitrospira sp.]